MQKLEKILEEIDKIYVDDIGVGVDCNLQGRSDLPCDNCYECIKDACKDIIRKHMNDGWIPVEERLPKEHDSIFAKWKGTDKWSKSMFEKTSGDVNVTVEYEDGKRKTITAHTVDGKWVLPNRIIKQKVIAWRPLPDPYHPERSERK